jgi:ubiquinone/menaquinone biosynthesis C-methylase UbiE
VSWFQEEPRVSLELIEALGLPPASAAIDVGGGASDLACTLVEQGVIDEVTVLDVSESALALAQERCEVAELISWVKADLLLWQPERQFDIWHDRAVFHFLVDLADRQRYVRLLGTALKKGGALILGTFASDGPEYCSGLPVVRFSAEQLGMALGPDFTVEGHRREEHITPAGAIQPFTWLTARRTAA